MEAAALTARGPGRHAIWWTVSAENEEEALRLLLRYVAERTNVGRVSEVEIQ